MNDASSVALRRNRAASGSGYSSDRLVSGGVSSFLGLGRSGLGWDSGGLGEGVGVSRTC